MDAQLKWTQGADLPTAMTAPQYTVIGNDLYVGGGKMEGEEYRESCKVFNYKASQNLWSILPATPNCLFGLGNVFNKPTIIGGRNPRVATGEVLTYEKDHQNWVSSLPPMPTPRIRACVVTHESGIVVCGGINLNPSQFLDTVEMFKHDTNQWYEVSPLPAPRAALRCTLIGNTAYFMGGYFPSMRYENGNKDCANADLFSDVNRQIDGKIVVRWKTLTEVPLSASSPANLCGSLLAVGGNGQPSGVHLFEPNTNTWLHINELPEIRFSCTAATLQSGQVIVVGGFGENRTRKASTFIGRIQRK